MKLTSKFGIISGLICSLLFMALFLVMLLAYSGKSDDKVYILILFLSIFLLSTISLFLEINHYIIISDNKVIIKNYFKYYHIHFNDIYQVEIYKPISTKYTTSNLIIFILKDQRNIRFKYLGLPNNDYIKHMKNVVGKGKLKLKGIPKKYFLFEFVAAIVLAILSFIGIILSIFVFSNYVIGFIALLILSIVGIVYYYKN